MEVGVWVGVVEGGLGHHVVELLEEIVLIFAHGCRDPVHRGRLPEGELGALGVLGLPRVREAGLLLQV